MTEAERAALRAHRCEAVGVFVEIRVAVGRGQQQQHGIAWRQRGAGDGHGFSGKTPRVVHGRIVPRGFFHDGQQPVARAG